MSDTTNEKAYCCDPVGFQNATTHYLVISTIQREGKAFASLAARYALAGLALTLGDPADGAVMRYADSWGSPRAWNDLDAAARFLVTIGGAV